MHGLVAEVTQDEALSQWSPPVRRMIEVRMSNGCNIASATAMTIEHFAASRPPTGLPYLIVRKHDSTPWITRGPRRRK